MSERPIVDLRGVVKKYGRVQVLGPVDLTINAGEKIALIGHNGAGKTTLFKIVLGLAGASEGSVAIMEQTPGAGSVRAQTAFLPENLAFHDALTGSEQLRLFCRLKGANDEVETLMRRVGLRDAMDRRIKTYSKGMRQRLGLAQLLIGKPKLAILDEPTSGLDPISRMQFYDILAELSDNGAAVLMSSHVLTELEARTDRIVILRGGSIVADGSLSQLRRRADLPVRLKVHAREGAADTIRRDLGGRKVNGRAVEIAVSAADKVARLHSITGRAEAIEDVDVIEPSLEDLYRFYSGEDDRDGVAR